MPWNWQLPDWPNFTYDPATIEPLERRFLFAQGKLAGAWACFPAPEQEGLLIDILGEEALRTSEIEGEILDRDSVLASLRRQFGLETDGRKLPPAEQGIAALMADLYRTYDENLSEAALHRWHEAICQGRRDLKAVGAYRRGAEPMQVVSGAVYAPKVHFEAPPFDRVHAEMKVFIDWFNGSAALPPLARAGLAHLHFVSIHPYEDGNGRMARALAVKALAQGANQPSLLTLASSIEQARKFYYAELVQANSRMDVTNWLVWFAERSLHSAAHSEEQMRFVVLKTRFYDRYADRLNARQAKVIARMFREGVSGFKGGLSAENYVRISGASRATATRDLHELVSLGALSRTGVLKGARYHLVLEP